MVSAMRSAIRSHDRYRDEAGLITSTLRHLCAITRVLSKVTLLYVYLAIKLSFVERFGSFAREKRSY